MTTTTDDCVLSLSEITNKEVAIARNRYSSSNNDEYLVERIYTLCPNTAFHIGFQVGPGLEYKDGSFPLLVLNPNLIVQCGNDGSSANNCILEGGDVQVLTPSTLDLPNTHPDPTNMTLRGLTFQGASLLTISFFQPGTALVIEDCIFQHIHSGNFVAYFEISNTTSSWDLTGNDLHQRKMRLLESKNTKLLSATFTGCTFFDNIVQSAMIGASDAQVDVFQTYFIQNVAGSMLWFVDGSIWTMEDTCHVDNTYALSIVVQQGNMQPFQSNRNFASNVAYLPVCEEGVMILADESSSLGDALNTSGYSCNTWVETNCFGPMPIRLTTSGAPMDLTLGTMMLWCCILMWVIR